MRSLTTLLCLVLVVLGTAAVSVGASETDCARPNNANYALKLAEDADIVVSGLAATALAPGAPICVSAGADAASTGSTGPDLQLQEGDQKDGSQVMLFWAQCVHKGALVCRNNEVDNTIKPPRCLIAVKVPKQTTEAGQLPPCTVERGLRYTLLLSSKAGASCDGVYSLQHSRITDSVRTHVGMQTCAPYPAWPSQDTSVNGTGLAGVLGRSCPGSTAPEVARCEGSNNPCTGKAACASDTAVTCVPKVCIGKYMVSSRLLSVDPCQPVFVSDVSGLPVDSCDVSLQRLARQARQAEKRLSADSGSQGAGGQAEAGDGSVQLPPLPSLQQGASDAAGTQP